MIEWRTFTDHAWQGLRYLAGLVVCHVVMDFYGEILEQPVKPASTKVVGFIIGFLLCQLMMESFCYMLKVMYGQSVMSTNDTFFMQDNKLNLCNVIGALKFEKFEFEPMRDYLAGKLDAMPAKIKSKIVKHYGMYMWEEMGAEEWKAKKKDLIVLVNGVHTKEQLETFMTQQQMIRDPMETVQYKIFLLPDFSETESVFVFKAHHALFDGLGCAIFFMALSD